MNFFHPRIVLPVGLCVVFSLGNGGCRRQPSTAKSPAAAASPPPASAPSAPPASLNTQGQPPKFAVNAVETREGTAIWYDVPDQSLAARRAWTDEMTAASDQLPQNTYVRVTRLAPGKTAAEATPEGGYKPVVVRVTDNGIHRKGVLIEVDRDAARLLGMVKAGETHVRVEVLALKNATADKPVEKKDDPVAPKASTITDKPVADAKDEKDAAQAKNGSPR